MEDKIILQENLKCCGNCAVSGDCPETKEGFGLCENWEWDTLTDQDRKF